MDARLLVWNPHVRARILKAPVLTSQIAPTISQALVLAPNRLTAVRGARTTILPGLSD